MVNPTADDIDNYHRLCVNYGTVIHAAQISSLFKQNGFDYDKTVEDLECMLNAGEYVPVPEDVDGSDFGEDDRVMYGCDGDAYGDDDDMEAMAEAEAAAAVAGLGQIAAGPLADEYIHTGKVCDEQGRPQTILPAQLSAIESSSVVDSLPPKEELCMNWLATGFCRDKGCQDLHTLYGVRCPRGQVCDKPGCLFVHTTILNQCSRAQDQLGISLRRPDEPQDNESIMSAFRAIEDAPLPSKQALAAAFPQKILPPGLTDRAASAPQDKKQQDELKKTIDDSDVAAGEFVPIDQEDKSDGEALFCAPKLLWSSQMPFLEKYRAFNNEQEIHIRMRLFHLNAALACPANAAADRNQHLAKALTHFDRERYLSLPLDRFHMLMANAHYAVFHDTNERVLYLYTLSVCEARDLLTKIFKGTPRRNDTFFVFGRKSRSQDSTDVILDDVRKFCDANGVTVVSTRDGDDGDDVLVLCH